MIKTRIVCTIGPSTWDKKVLQNMYENGFRLARINSAFADHAELARVKKIMSGISSAIGLLMDCQGPKLRIKGITNPLEVKHGQKLTLSTDSRQKKLPYITYGNLHKDITIGTNILIDDGNIQAVVANVENREITVTIKNEGILIDGKTINVPHTHLNIPLLSEKDIENIQSAVELNYDYIGASFVQTASDISHIREVAHRIKKTTQIGIIAKIETTMAVANFAEILREADGIMIARGDLGVELPLFKVPTLQKRFIKMCKAAGKPVIVATQMLESMKESPRPTRAEVSDVANAVLDGTDAVMLSAETSTGKYPTKAVEVMYNVAEETEANNDAPSILQFIPNDSDSYNPQSRAVVEGAIQLAQKLNLSTIVVFTRTGRTAQLFASYLPNQYIIALTDNSATARKLAISRGVIPICIVTSGRKKSIIPNDRDEFIKFIIEHSRKELKKLNDKSIVIANMSSGKRSGGIIEVYEV